LEIKSYTWVDRFEPGKAEVGPTSTPGNLPDADNYNEVDTSDTIKIVIGTISGVFGIVFIATMGFIGYKWYQYNKQIRQNTENDILRIPSNDHRETYQNEQDDILRIPGNNHRESYI